VGWQMVFLGLPVVYVIFRSYRLYLGRLESEKRHAEEIAALHLRTIEALALAIEAKDETTHEHLQRVQVYAVELGKELRLSDGALHALHAASILHDIGKLAVPEHIISKPGKLTPEEFEKMKIHPIVGAEILARVQDPSALLNSLPNSHSTPELQLKLQEGENFELIARLQKSATFPDADQVVTIDGLRVEYPDGFGLARSSNTTPVVVMRFEADNDAALKRIQEDFRRVILAEKADAQLPF